MPSKLVGVRRWAYVRRIAALEPRSPPSSSLSSCSASSRWACSDCIAEAEARFPAVDIVGTTRVSKRWFRAREIYGIEIAAAQDVPLLLAVTVCIDALSERG